MNSSPFSLVAPQAPTLSFVSFSLSSTTPSSLFSSPIYSLRLVEGGGV